MKHTFLHISDLHFRPDWYEEHDLVFSKFIEDLGQQVKNFDHPMLAFTGDLVNAGGDDGIYVAFRDKVETALNELGISRASRICIPGNHDVSRTDLAPVLTIQKGVLGEITDEEAFNRDFAQLSALVFARKFANYIAAEAKFAEYTCCQNGLGGSGWDLPNGVGVYCLNTALCSFGGLEDLATGEKISDKDRLMIDTRSLHQWLQQSASKTRVLLMHHPLDWLAGWARAEIENVMSRKFRLILSGHIHRGSSIFSTCGDQGALHCVAPALFTRKRDDLGYAFITLDTATQEIEITYRQKTPTHKFVAGTNLADNDSGKRMFPLAATPALPFRDQDRPVDPVDTLAVLQAEFDEACTSYSSKRQVWVDRDLAATSETASEQTKAVLVDPLSFSQNPRNCVIRAPKQHGLTCLGRFIVVEHRRQNPGAVMIMCDLGEVPAHPQGVLKYIQQRRTLLHSEHELVAAFILDHWQKSQNAQKVLRIIEESFPEIPIIILQGFDDFHSIGATIAVTTSQPHEVLFLWSLSRRRIRELVSAYLEAANCRLDEDLVTKKLTEDVDALNIHRTPLNFLLILKLVERSFDDSPVNRTEVISKVLYFLFHEFDRIPTYATRPDLKDCEYGLGYFCEWMIRNDKRSFTQDEFLEQVRKYCTKQMIDLDVGLLFSFLATENIFIRRGLQFAFRFSYWLYFFAAHRMHHDNDFAEFILSDVRYTAFPEVIEFYTGIDRRRTDAVVRLTEDLKRMDAAFLQRTGIASDLNPLGRFLWTPNEESIKRLQQEVVDSIQESALPSAVKDAIADKGYDRSKPYHQEVALFISEASVDQMIQAMRGAARALRNSDHVSPAARTELLDAVIQCWIRMCQVVVVLSPLLAANKKAEFEGLGFILDQTFDGISDVKGRWRALMTAIVDNIVDWYQMDIFSKKLGSLFTNYARTREGTLGELLVMLLLIKQRPPGWEATLKAFILRAHKNSFYLYKVHRTLWREFRVSFASEAVRQELRNLAAMSVAKHETGAKRPNLQLIAKVAKLLDEKVPKE